MTLNSLAHQAMATLVAAGIAASHLPGAARAQETTDPVNEVRLVIVNEGGETVAMAVAAGSGPFVATAQHNTEFGIAVGVISSVGPVEMVQDDVTGGFILFTSPVGIGLGD